MTVLVHSRQTSSMFELAFSDEDYRRQVTTLWDFVHVQDARIDRATNTLWLLISGGWGVFDRARLYEYDLNSRTIARELDFDPEDLPSACPQGARQL
jgi:hypothetical protein